MDKIKKKSYTQPQSDVTRVELESPICSGSAVINNPNEAGYKIEDQEVNAGFDSGTGATWDTTVNNN